VAGGYTEPSSLFAFFRSKCVLVNHAQSRFWTACSVIVTNFNSLRVFLRYWISFLFFLLYEKDELRALPDDWVDLNMVVLLSRFWQKDGRTGIKRINFLLSVANLSNKAGISYWPNHHLVRHRNGPLPTLWW
jgi:hypothetical protein